MQAGSCCSSEVILGKFFIALSLFGLSGYATDPWLAPEDIHAIVGEPSRIAAAPVSGPITVVSWNIAQGVQYERVRDTLKALDADVYLLQEVDMGVRRSNYRDVAKDLARDLDLNWVFAGEFQEIGQARRSTPAVTGQAVLSRFPIERAAAVRFKNQANLRWRFDPLQPRRGGRMALRAESGGLVLYNAHIESAKDDAFRHKQIDEVLFDEGAALGNRPVIFAGDFNTSDGPGAAAILRCLGDEGFVDALGSSEAARRTSVRHEQPLDWIFVRNLTASQGTVVSVPKASDHFPLTAAVAIDRAATAD